MDIFIVCWNHSIVKNIEFWLLLLLNGKTVIHVNYYKLKSLLSGVWLCRVI